MLDERQVGSHEVAPFRPERNGTVDTLRWAKKRLAVPCLLEIDVTKAREAIRTYRNRTGTGLSLTAWIIFCVARAAAEHPRVHAVRGGKRKLILFHDVDVAVPIERAIGAGNQRETLPMPYVIRKANAKTPAEIHNELRHAQTASIAAGEAAIATAPRPRLQSAFFRLPCFVRDLVFWRPLLRSPARIKKTMGTVVVTSVNTTIPGMLAWGVPLSIHPLAIGIGGIAKRNTGQGVAEILGLSVVFDHEVTDGAPIGRFIRHLCDLITRADALA
jgi:pyruvate/2-oxoglutarate dehydrogenase complex dihydrolipoamide acyltransferase (E2) component